MVTVQCINEVVIDPELIRLIVPPTTNCACDTPEIAMLWTPRIQLQDQKPNLAFAGYSFLFKRKVCTVEYRAAIHRLFEVILCKTNSCRTLMVAVVPRAIAAFSNVNAAP